MTNTTKSTTNTNYQMSYSYRKPSWVAHSLWPSLGSVVFARTLIDWLVLATWGIAWVLAGAGLALGAPPP